MTHELDDLRPVELLWILSEEGDQSWTRKSSLQAALISMSMRGLIRPEGDGEGFRPTADAHLDEDADLRPYEVEIRDAIVGIDDGERMVNAVYEYDFEADLRHRGFYRRREEQKSLLFGLITWTETVGVSTDRCAAVLDELDRVRDDLADAVERGRVRPEQVPMVYAFPDAEFSGEFAARSDELVVDIEELNDEGVADIDVDEMVSAPYPRGTLAASGSAGGMGSPATCATVSDSTAADAVAACDTGVGVGDFGDTGASGGEM
ncbi:hypothetical protein [Candidatus Halobonum tyrrellensis]|uniref:Uncharacterized protein n=1 Tax=Candidatus Halobonum tyrrellensis G22 TaxID=1324957 RepID=V4HDP9_9EURY|nr:hypothetical protein [Candidatus Halobonum tyrrellensis]ESP88208.1 hypothetical protein K933_10370 [Candidatus Halobonum tyrrellensis G22]